MWLRVYILLVLIISFLPTIRRKLNLARRLRNRYLYTWLFFFPFIIERLFFLTIGLVERYSLLIGFVLGFIAGIVGYFLISRRKNLLFSEAILVFLFVSLTIYVLKEVYNIHSLETILRIFIYTLTSTLFSFYAVCGTLIFSLEKKLNKSVVASKSGKIDII